MYAVAIPVSRDQTQLTVKAMAIKAELQQSKVSEAHYIIDYLQVAAPQFSLAEGIVYPDQGIEITANTPEATIYYTLDDTDPSESSLLFTAPIQLTGADNILYALKARAFKTRMKPSDIKQLRYTLNLRQKFASNGHARF